MSCNFYMAVNEKNQTNIGCVCVTRQHLVQIIENLATSKEMRGLGIASLVSTADLFQTFRWHGRMFHRCSCECRGTLLYM